MQRRLLLMVVIGLIAVACDATDKKQLSTAVAAVEANMKTAAGQQYDAEIGKQFTQEHLTTVRQCKQAEAGTPATFDLLIRVDATGKVDGVLLYPETAVGTCVRKTLVNSKFSPPPHGDYWFDVHMQFK